MPAENIRPSHISAFTAADGKIVDPQSDAMAALKSAQVAGKSCAADPQSDAMAVLKQAS